MEKESCGEEKGNSAQGAKALAWSLRSQFRTQEKVRQPPGTTAPSKGAPGTKKIARFGVVCPVRYFGDLLLDDWEEKKFFFPFLIVPLLLPLLPSLTYECCHLPFYKELDL